MKNAVNWFEIPVKNFERAKKFYETILDSEIHQMPNPKGKYGLFPADMENGGIGGAIIEGAGYEPSQNGSIIYLNVGIEISIPLSKVEKAGGKVIVPKTAIGGSGFIAHFVDTEGNRVAFHSPEIKM